MLRNKNLEWHECIENRIENMKKLNLIERQKKTKIEKQVNQKLKWIILKIVY